MAVDGVVRSHYSQPQTLPPITPDGILLLTAGKNQITIDEQRHKVRMVGPVMDKILLPGH